MGIGSALFLAESVQLATIGLGAVGATVLIARGAPWSAAFGGAVLMFLGAATLNLEHDATIGSLAVSHGLSGAGFGAILAVAFVRAAELRSHHVLSTAMLLLAMVAGRAVAGTLAAWGPGALVLVGGLVALLSTGMAGEAATERAGVRTDTADGAGRGTPVIAIAPLTVAGISLAVGSVAVLAGADANLILVTLLLQPLGPQQLASLHVWRIVLLVAGIGLVALGCAIVQRRQNFSPHVRSAILATAAAAAMSAAAVSALRMAGAIGVVRSGGGSLALVDFMGLAATATGLAIGAAALRIPRGRPIASLGGATILITGTALTLAWLTWPAARSGPWAHPAVLAAWVGTGAGIVSIVLRVALAEAHRRERTLAVVGGLAAAALFAGLGAVLGAAGTLPLVSGDPVAVSIAGLATLVAIAGLVASLHLRAARPVGAAAGAADRHRDRESPPA